MRIDFSPDVETRLRQIAFANEKSVEQLVKDVVDRMLENHARFVAGVRRGIEQADQGELIGDDEVRLWLEQRERSRST